ncbi:MAG: undecaprenyl-phosphate galactose phosphotransferase WbaP [Elusimicrobia bacterium]|nr:undecaprenyl-phosphate galactose phosphotransferase WbaP [Elusimicrobiota bacterium]
MTLWPKIKNRFGILLLLLADIATLLTLFHISVLIRINILPEFFSSLPLFNQNLETYWWIFIAWPAIMIYEGGYSKRFTFWDEMKFLTKSSFFALITIFAILFISKKGPEFSRILILTMATIAFPLFPIVRPFFKKILFSFGLLKRKVIIAGSGIAAETALKSILNEPNLGYEIVGFIDDNPLAKEICGFKVRQGLNQIERYIKKAGIHDVIVAKQELKKDEIAKLINHIQHKAENTLYMPDIKGIAVSGSELKYFFQEQALVLEIKNNLAQPLNYISKRLIDYISAIFITIILFVPMLAIIIRIKLTSKGPAIYTQERIGKNGKYFMCYKFTSMYTDAEERLQKILTTDPEAKKEWEEYWKLKDDPRITETGKFLRKTSLDELPQLLNILKGEMSLIGPRPYLPREWKFIKEESHILHALPPGITGLWQVSGRNNQDYNYRITMDSWYVKNWDLWLDIMILFKTVGVVIKRDGAC